MFKYLTIFGLRDYADCWVERGLGLPGVCGFVDGTFHSMNRPGRDGFNGNLQRLSYRRAKKGNGLVFEIISFPDGMIGRAFGPVSGRYHDLYLALKSGLLTLREGEVFVIGHGLRMFIHE
jgi:hypothetical protein